MFAFLKYILFVIFLNYLSSPDISKGYEHGMAMHGAVKYKKGFENFDYAYPNAPKEGKIKLSSIGTFDNLNPYILKGVAAWQTAYLFETLMKSSSDEAFSQYGLLADGIKVPTDRSWVSFRINPKAKFSNQTPVLAEDVVFSFNIITTKGHPAWKNYYSQVDRAEKLGDREVKFFFKGEINRELPLIIGYQLPIFSKKYWEGKDFSKTTLTPPIGSGPYLISDINPGRSITLKRDPNYWGKNLNVNKGKFNFEEIHTDFYRDETVAMEAFKSGTYDFKLENSSKNWATSYKFNAVKNQKVIVEEIPYERPSGMQGFAFNTRKSIFKNRNVRKALTYAFDFEWSNKNLFYGAYTRTKSFFDNSELSSQSLPNSRELKILKKYEGKIPNEVFNEIYKPPTTIGEENSLRNNLRVARRILKKEGWIIKDDKLVNEESGEIFKFEILLRSPLFERIVLPLKRNFKKLGIDVNIRTVQDDSQYQKRLEEFDFDMIVSNFGSVISPGNEQKNWWGSDAANQVGSMNVVGVQDPVIDDVINKLISAKNREELVDYTRVLDRILLFNYFLIPQFHIGHYRVAYWDKFSRPKLPPKYDLGFDFWWYDAEKNKNLGKTLEKKEEDTNDFNYFYYLLIIFIIFLIFYKKKKKNA